MAEEGGEADPWRGETLDSHEGRLGLGKPFDEMGGSRERGGEAVSQPSDLTLGHKDRLVKVDRSIGDGVSVPLRTPVDELRLGDGQADAQPGPSGLQPCILLL